MFFFKSTLIFFFIFNIVKSYSLCAAFSDITNKTLKNTGVKADAFSLAIYDLKKDKYIYLFNEKKQLSMASVTKLFVTAAAVNILGQDFRFKTRIYTDGENLYVQGDGDPLFVSETMWYFVNNLVNIGIKQIKGDIILDDSAFNTEIIYQGESDRAYSAKVSPLSVNFNSVAVNVISGSSTNINIDPPTSMLNLKNQTNLKQGKTKLEIRRYNNDLVVGGIVSSNNYEYKTVYRNISEPLLYFGEVLKLHLKWRDINFSNKILINKVPSNATLLFEIESKRLCDLLADMNRFSNNFIAEQLLRAISIKVAGKPANTQKGLTAIKKYLSVNGLASNDYNIVDTSGLSRENKSSTLALINFLKSIYNDFDTGPELINSLSISGMDGTIKKTIGVQKLKGKVRAKSGTLTGVRGLAGYISGKNSVYAFVILANHANVYKLINWEYKILEAIWDL